ncbi:glycoside hydrolase family 13 protein [Arthrobacter echini]|uniref:Glycoside hydrolase family 13 protein n=1 Tax=Arthrobacter echini TaxID=1529066 RepID=A0A4S5E5Q4_9MICC|nr:glycoside hydrolase family 13 protein [Arthrobacter echini]
MLHHPHHDGSTLYVPEQAPALGDVVNLRIFVPHDARGESGASAVTLRAVLDGEPHLAPAEQEESDASGTWWRAPLRLVNPVTRYRFLLTGPPESFAGAYAWLNATGIHRREVTDTADFRMISYPPTPDWVADAVVYQVFPDRFGRSAAADTRTPPMWARPAAWDDAVVHQGPRTPLQFFGGDLAGIVEHLDHVAELGATVLYLTPFFPAHSNHRYDASTFDRVDPSLGGDEAFTALVNAAHARGLRVMGDLTTNHTGDSHEWFLAAQADAEAPETAYYFFEKHPDDYASWFDLPSLPKLDHSSTALRRRMYEGADSVVSRWLTAGLDAWRIDVANMTGRYGAQDLAHDVARTLVATAREAKSDVWVLAEHGHDAGPDLQGDGWHGTMDYAGFTRPVWTWLGGAENSTRPFFGQPTASPVLGGIDVVTGMREVHAEMPWRAQTASTLHLDSHDLPRFRTATGGDGSGDISLRGREKHLVGTVLQLTMPGVPSIFAGDEIGLTGVDGEHSRTPFPWNRQQEWDTRTLEFYRLLIELRREYVALRRGGLRWVHVGDDSMTFLREHDGERILVHAARADHPPVILPSRALGIASADDLIPLLGERCTRAADYVLLPSGGPRAHVYRLTAEP